MAGVRDDGILLVDQQGGGGAPVAISSPIGPNTSADSVSVTIATDQSPIPITGTVNAGLGSSTTPADNTAAVPMGKVAAWNMLFDGVTWDRARGDSVDGALVNLGANNDIIVTGYTLTDELEIEAPVSGVGIIFEFDVKAGSNSLAIALSGTFVGTVSFSYATVYGLDVTIYLFNTRTGKWVNSITNPALTGEILIMPVIPGYAFLVRCRCTAYTSGLLEVKATSSQSNFIENSLTDQELRASPIQTIITDGVDNANIRPATQIPTLAADTAVVVGLRETSTAFGTLGTSFVAVGGKDSVGTGQFLPLRSAADPWQDANTDTGVLVKPINHWRQRSATFNSLASSLSVDVGKVNGGSCFIHMVDAASTFDGQVVANLQFVSGGPGSAVKPIRVSDGQAVDVMVRGASYFIPCAGCDFINLTVVSYTTGTIVIRAAVSPSMSTMQGQMYVNNSSANPAQTMPRGLVSDTPQSYLDGQLQPLSLSSDGRLRVSSVPASIPEYEDITPDFDFFGDPHPDIIVGKQLSPW